MIAYGKRAADVDDKDESRKRVAEYKPPAPLSNPLLRKCANDLTSRFSGLCADVLRYIVDPMTRVRPGVVPNELFSTKLDMRPLPVLYEDTETDIWSAAVGPYGEVAVLSRNYPARTTELRVYSDEHFTTLLTTQVVDGGHHCVAITTNNIIVLYGKRLDHYHMDGTLFHSSRIAGNKYPNGNCIADDKGGVVFVTHDHHSIYRVDAAGEHTLVENRRDYVTWLIFARGDTIAWEGKDITPGCLYRSSETICKALVASTDPVPLFNKTYKAFEDGAGRFIWSYNCELYRTPAPMSAEPGARVDLGTNMTRALAVMPSGRVLCWHHKLKRLCYYVPQNKLN